MTTTSTPTTAAYHQSFARQPARTMAEAVAQAQQNEQISRVTPAQQPWTPEVDQQVRIRMGSDFSYAMHHERFDSLRDRRVVGLVLEYSPGSTGLDWLVEFEGVFSWYGAEELEAVAVATPSDIHAYVEADAITKRLNERVDHRLPLTTPVLLANGVTGVIVAHSSCDSSRYEVAWFDEHYWQARRRWYSRTQFEVETAATPAAEATGAGR